MSRININSPGTRNAILGRHTHNRFARYKMFCSILLMFPLCLLQTRLAAQAPCHASNILYVDGSATGGANDGSSWVNAYTSLADAVLKAHSCTIIDSILVAQGTYYPEYRPVGNNNRDKTFYFSRDGLAVLGGYPSGGGARNARANPTILSGDLDQSGTRSSDDAHHVMIVAGTSAAPLSNSLVIDGFGFTLGNANTNSNITLNGVAISRQNGGAMHNVYAAPVLSNCDFYTNYANTGGGIYNNYADVTIDNCNFWSNSPAQVSVGGAIFNAYSNVNILNSKIIQNYAANGGGLFNGTNSKTNIINCLFLNNNGSNGGAIVNNPGTNGWLNIRNSTFSRNTAGTNGRNILNQGILSVSNSVMYGNSTQNPGILNVGTSASLTRTNSLIQGLSGGTNGNIDGDTDPLYVNNTSTITPPHAIGDYSLQRCSPAIDAGSNALAPSGDTTDLAGNGRIYNNGTVDMGAYEYHGNHLANVLYVDGSATGANNGNSWANAFTSLADAVLVAHNCNYIDSILVAQGTYYPEYSPVAATNRDRTFYFLRDGLAVLGGYPSGGGTRDWAANATILSGDLNKNGIGDDDAYHVLLAAGTSGSRLSNSLVIDGFTVKGAYNATVSTSITVNSITINRGHGAGMYNLYASPTISNTVFSGNLAQSSGGGMYNNNASSPKIINCVFSGNVAQSSGGGMYNNSNSSPKIINCVFSGNKSSNTINYGAAMYNALSSPEITNTTISGNSGNNAIYNTNNCYPVISNTIIWGNSGGNAILSLNNSTTSVTYSIVQGTGTGTGNLNADPQFANAPSPNTAPFLGGDYRTGFCSPAVNAGSNALVPAGITTDLAGNDRRYNNGTVDMGAYERQSDASSSDNVGLSQANSNSLAFTPSCEESGWTWYADPNNPDSLSFAIAWGTGNNAAKAAAQIRLTEDAAHFVASNNMNTATVTMKRFWNVDLGAATLANPVSVRFFFDAADTIGMRAVADALNIGSSGALKWFKTAGVPFNTNLVTDGNINNGNYISLTPVYGTINDVAYVQFDGLTSFSGGTAGIGVGSGSPLPLDLLSFSAHAVDNAKAKLVWQAANERNVHSISVERSAAGSSWATIASLPAKGPGMKNDYEAWDNKPLSGTNLYRLKLTDNDGSFSYSRVEKVHFTQEGKTVFFIYPNPASGSFALEAKGMNTPAQLNVYDMLGREIYTAPISEGINIISSASLDNGVYQLQVTDKNSVLFLQKLIINK